MTCLCCNLQGNCAIGKRARHPTPTIPLLGSVRLGAQTSQLGTDYCTYVKVCGERAQNVHTKPVASSFSFLYTNVGSLLNKRTEREAHVAENDTDIIALTEILPQNYKYEVQKAELNLKVYTLHYEAKPDHRGIYTKANLKASLCEK